MGNPQDKTKHILFVTGKLAYPNLLKVLKDMEINEFTYSVQDLGLSVAALMTTNIVKRRLKDTENADLIVLPGRFRGDLNELSDHFGITVERGPEELKDLPSFFGRAKQKYDMSATDVLILGEITEAPTLSPETTLAIALDYKKSGADIIDLGFLPDTPFPQLKETITLLKEHHFKISVDTHNTDQLLLAAKSGADYLLSLKRETLWVADETDAIPIIIPDTPQQLNTLYECINVLQTKNKRFIADPILDPIHCGFTDSVVRYHKLHHDYPEVEVMMGIGNLTELTHADSAGVNALLLGIISELNIKYLLTTQVSEHCRCAIKEADIARRIMAVARAHNTPPTSIDSRLMALHERKPFPYDSKEIKAFAEGVKDSNFRIQNSEQGVHVYNRDLYKTATDPFDFYTDLNVSDDGGHAFYLGVELGRAQIAWQLGKRYNQDEELSWGCAVEPKEEDLSVFKEGGVTLKEKREKIKTRKKSKQ